MRRWMKCHPPTAWQASLRSGYSCPAKFAFDLGFDDFGKHTKASRAVFAQGIEDDPRFARRCGSGRVGAGEIDAVYCGGAAAQQAGRLGVVGQTVGCAEGGVNHGDPFQNEGHRCDTRRTVRQVETWEKRRCVDNSAVFVTGCHRLSQVVSQARGIAIHLQIKEL